MGVNATTKTKVQPVDNTFSPILEKEIENYFVIGNLNALYLRDLKRFRLI